MGKTKKPLNRAKHNGKKGVLILAIETSCDETAAAVLKYGTGKFWPQVETLSSVVHSQISLHSKMGGVVPEVAARAHVKYILPIVQKALDASRVTLGALDYIAVTQGPGLIPSLLVGVEFAKALSLAANKPLLPVNHMAGHLYSPFKQVQDLKLQAKDVFPQVALIVSGGHTILALVKDAKRYEVLGQTVDDAAGEAFDKVAKLLQLPYPGGPQVSKQAELGQAQAIAFPRPMIHSKDYNFSFAGLKTAVLYHLRAQGQGLSAKAHNLSPAPSALSTTPDICASFQQAVIDVLVAKAMRAAKQYKAKSVSLSGGVSANKSLREALRTSAEAANLKLFVPELHLSTDNAEMIGIAAAFSLFNGKKPVPAVKIQADPGLEL